MAYPVVWGWRGTMAKPVDGVPGLVRGRQVKEEEGLLLDGKRHRCQALSDSKSLGHVSVRIRS